MPLLRRKYLLAVVVAASVALMGIALWRALSDNSETVVPSLVEYPVRGVDVSNHNGVIDYKALAADSIRFVFVKATEGSTFVDASFHRNFHGAKKAGLAVTAYHFFRFDRPGSDQAINLLHSLRGKTIDMPVVIDVEQWSNPSNHPDSRVIDRLENMAAYLRERGIPVMFYTNRKGLDKFISDGFADYPLWYCTFGQPPADLNWQFWQYTHTGTAKGVKGEIDLNVFRGSEKAFADSVARWRTLVR